MKRKINITAGIIMLTGAILVIATELMRVGRHRPSDHPLVLIFIAVLFIVTGIYYAFFKDRE